MVRETRAWKTARGAGLLAVTACAAVLALAGCQVFTTTPFPAFLDKTDVSLDLSSRIDAIANGKGISSYDLEVVTDPLDVQPARVLLLAEPPSTDSSGDYNYTGKIIVMDQDLNILGEATTGSTSYFSKPYSYTHDGSHMLAGHEVLTPSGAGVQTIVASGLTGFAFVYQRPTEALSTWVFSTPPGDYTSFDLSFVGYSTGSWSPNTATPFTLPIIPVANRPSTSDPNYANLGYQLVGLSYDGSTYLTFILSQPSTGRIVATRLDAQTATAHPTATSSLLPTGDWPVSADVDRPAVGVDAGGLFLVRRDGWMDRYTWGGTGVPLSTTGAPVEIVGDRSLSRQYAFLVQPGSSPSYMYRFDPSSRVLTRYKRWW